MHACFTGTEEDVYKVVGVSACYGPLTPGPVPLAPPQSPYTSPLFHLLTHSLHLHLLLFPSIYHLHLYYIPLQPPYLAEPFHVWTLYSTLDQSGHGHNCPIFLPRFHISPYFQLKLVWLFAHFVLITVFTSRN